MKQKKLFLLLVAGIAFTTAYSQETPHFSWGVECGTSTVNGNLNEKWAVRQDVSSYNGDYGYGNSGSLNTSMSLYSIGFKPEYSFSNDRLSVFSGLRFTRINSYMDKGSSGSGDFFYLRYKTTSTSSEYCRVTNIEENNDYVGIPLELRYTPFRIDNFDFFVKAGTEVGFKLASKTDIAFTTESMNAYKDEILNSVGVKVNSLYSTFYGSIGVKYSPNNRINYNLDIYLPSTFLTTNNSTLIIPQNFSGFQFSVQIPITTQKK